MKRKDIRSFLPILLVGFAMATNVESVLPELGSYGSAFFLFVVCYLSFQKRISSLIGLASILLCFLATLVKDEIVLKDSVSLMLCFLALRSFVAIYGLFRSRNTIVSSGSSQGALVDPRDSKDFYISSEWRKLRKIAIDLYGKKCMKCGSVHRIHVDHIKPRSLFPEKAYDLNNLQILCEKCNLKKSNKNTNDYRKIAKKGSFLRLRSA